MRAPFRPVTAARPRAPGGVRLGPGRGEAGGPCAAWGIREERARRGAGSAQIVPMRTSRSFAPLAGPTTPRFSIASTIFAARL